MWFALVGFCAFLVAYQYLITNNTHFLLAHDNDDNDNDDDDDDNDKNVSTAATKKQLQETSSTDNKNNGDAISPSENDMTMAADSVPSNTNQGADDNDGGNNNDNDDTIYDSSLDWKTTLLQPISNPSSSLSSSSLQAEPRSKRLMTISLYYWLYMLSLHILSFSFYAIPLFLWKSTHHDHHGFAVLDEMHIVTQDHKDIYYTGSNGSSSGSGDYLSCWHHPDENNHNHNNASSNVTRAGWWFQNTFTCWVKMFFVERRDPVWMNDYWGRSMNSPSSHKSWRPLTVLSFRYLRFPQIMNDLDSHRLVNAILHAAVGECVALLALLLFGKQKEEQQQHRITWQSTRTTSTRHFYSDDGDDNNNKNSNKNWFYTMCLYTFAKLLFCLHPTHVEVTANAANRPHLIAVAATCLLANPQLPLPLFWVVLLAGFLSAETFLFGLVPAAATLCILSYRQQQQLLLLQQRQQFGVGSRVVAVVSCAESKRFLLWEQTLLVWTQHWIRLISLMGGAILYYAGRQSMDWLSIPTGLIRPAENPYFRLTGDARVVNYAHVTALHVAKAWDLDWVGFSHEYGYQCLTPLESWDDHRLYRGAGVAFMLLFVLPFVWFVILGKCIAVQTIQLPSPPAGNVFTTNEPGVYEARGSTSVSAAAAASPSASDSAAPPIPPQQKRVSVWSASFLLWIFHLSWLATLFPIMGIVKVGTFVADRIVVTCSVSVCILMAHILASWVAFSYNGDDLYYGRRRWRFRPMPWLRWGSIVLVFLLAWRRIHLRTWEWMDSYPLLLSSLKTCPRSAKSHLEISKIYSGLYPERFDLKQARWHLEQVEEIDPTYCDVHYQFVHVALQEQSLLELEERLVKALTCPFNTWGAMDLWKRYWEMVLGPLTSRHLDARVAALQRQQNYQAELQESIKKVEQEQKEDEENKSHFVHWRGRTVA